jgi:hypothetical protein
MLFLALDISLQFEHVVTQHFSHSLRPILYVLFINCIGWGGNKVGII